MFKYIDQYMMNKLIHLNIDFKYIIFFKIICIIILTCKFFIKQIKLTRK